MYYPLYNNPFYYPYRAYIPYSNMCSYTHAPQSSNRYINYVYEDSPDMENLNKNSGNVCNEAHNRTNENSDDLFTITNDRLEIFGISINIDDLIILIMLFFMFRENNLDYSVIIILALILFDQS